MIFATSVTIPPDYGYLTWIILAHYSIHLQILEVILQALYRSRLCGSEELALCCDCCE